jgi:hypothetical protein
MFQCLKVLALSLRIRRGGGLEACGRDGKWVLISGGKAEEYWIDGR